jgi:hypothetical protein
LVLRYGNILLTIQVSKFYPEWLIHLFLQTIRIWTVEILF